MTDYARVAETLKAILNPSDNSREYPSVPEERQALTAAAALCESVAAPVDEAKEALDNRAWRDRLIADGNSPPTQFDAWLARARSDARAKVVDWQPIETAPADMTPIWLWYKNAYGKKRFAHAQYIPRYTEQSDNDGAEYCEEKDDYYTPEGWYEICENSDEYSAMKMCGCTPLGWQPLPPSPTIEGERG